MTTNSGSSPCFRKKKLLPNVLTLLGFPENKKHPTLSIDQTRRQCRHCGVRLRDYYSKVMQTPRQGSVAGTLYLSRLINLFKPLDSSAWPYRPMTKIISSVLSASILLDDGGAENQPLACNMCKEKSINRNSFPSGCKCPPSRLHEKCNADDHKARSRQWWSFLDYSNACHDRRHCNRNHHAAPGELLAN